MDQCPRLNPQFEYDDDTKYDIGNVAHRLISAAARRSRSIDFPDWRTKSRQEAAREEAADEGRIAVLNISLSGQFRHGRRGSGAAGAPRGPRRLQNGAGEVMIAWQEDGIWCRALIDWLHDDLRTVDDFKTSGMSMAPHIIGCAPRRRAGISRRRSSSEGSTPRPGRRRPPPLSFHRAGDRQAARADGHAHG
jgi:hypothetical protein